MTFDDDTDTAKLVMCPRCGMFMGEGESVYNIKDLVVAENVQPVCFKCYLDLAPWYEVLVHERKREILLCLAMIALSIVFLGLTIIGV